MPFYGNDNIPTALINHSICNCSTVLSGIVDVGWNNVCTQMLCQYDGMRNVSAYMLNPYMFGFGRNHSIPNKPIWDENDLFWIVVGEEAGPLKLLEIVLKDS